MVLYCAAPAYGGHTYACLIPRGKCPQSIGLLLLFPWSNVDCQHRGSRTRQIARRTNAIKRDEGIICDLWRFHWLAFIALIANADDT